MPNHCENDLVVSGPVEDVKAFWEIVKQNPMRGVDFTGKAWEKMSILNAHYPMPEIFADADSYIEIHYRSRSIPNRPWIVLPDSWRPSNEGGLRAALTDIRKQRQENPRVEYRLVLCVMYEVIDTETEEA